MQGPPPLPSSPPYGVSPMPEKRPNWPIVIGIIAVVFGVGGILTGGLGLLGPVFNQVAADLDPSQAAVYEAQAKYQWWGVGLSAAALIVAAWLLWGGVGLLRRRPESAGRLKQWAVAKLLLTLGMVGFQAVITPAVFEATQQAQPQQSGPAMPEGFTQAIVFASVVFTLLWGAALPTFMLVWFTRQNVRDEARSWGDTPAPRAE